MSQQNETAVTTETTTDPSVDANEALKGKQTVTLADVGPARKSLTIEVPAERIAEKIKEAFERVQRDTVLPGFRRGRAPRHLLEKRLGEGVRNEVRGQLLSECYTQAVEDQKLDVIGEPEVKDVDKIVLPESGPLVFSVEVEVSPQVELPSFEGITVTSPAIEVADADVDAEIKELCERHGKANDVTEGAVQFEDYVQADVKILEGTDAKIEGGKFIGEQPAGSVYVRGKDGDFRGHVAGIVVEDLGQRLAGKKVGDEVSISLNGPAGHEDVRIRNMPITILLKINRIERVEPAAIDTLPTRFGLDSVDELKQRVRESVQQRKERQRTQDQHQQLCNQLLERVQMELPKGLSSRQTVRVLRRKAMELAYAGTPEKEIEQRIAEMRAGSEEEAQRQLKLFFILDKAAETLKIEVTDGEINGRIAMIAMQQGRRPEKLRQQMSRSGELDQIYLQLREQKTLDAILEKAAGAAVAAPATT
jgi:trigger factor